MGGLADPKLPGILHPVPKSFSLSLTRTLHARPDAFTVTQILEVQDRTEEQERKCWKRKRATSQRSYGLALKLEREVWSDILDVLPQVLASVASSLRFCLPGVSEIMEHGVWSLCLPYSNKFFLIKRTSETLWNVIVLTKRVFLSLFLNTKLSMIHSPFYIYT